MSNTISLSLLSQQSQDLLIHYEECRRAVAERRYFRARKLFRKGSQVEAIQRDLDKAITQLGSPLSEVDQSSVEQIKSRLEKLTSSPHFKEIHSDLQHWSGVQQEWFRLRQFYKKVRVLHKAAFDYSDCVAKAQDYSARAGKESIQFLKHLYEDKVRKYQHLAEQAKHKLEKQFTEDWKISGNDLERFEALESQLGKAAPQELSSSLMKVLGRAGRLNASGHERCLQLIRQIRCTLQESRAQSLSIEQLPPIVFELEGDLKYAFNREAIQMIRTKLSHFKARVDLAAYPLLPDRLQQLEQAIAEREQRLDDPKLVIELEDTKKALERSIQDCKFVPKLPEMKEQMDATLKKLQTRYAALVSLSEGKVSQAAAAH